MAGKPKYVQELEAQVADLLQRIEVLEARPVVEAAPVTTDIFQNGKKVTNRMISTLVRLGDFEDFETGRQMAVSGFQVAARLDEWTAVFPNVKRIFCAKGRSCYHTDKEEARDCSLTSAK